jgi:hypothetical protein
MSQQQTTNQVPGNTEPTSGPTVDEVDIEVGFILGCTCSSLELDDDDDFEAFDDAEIKEDSKSD